MDVIWGNLFLVFLDFVYFAGVFPTCIGGGRVGRNVGK